MATYRKRRSKTKHSHRAPKLERYGNWRNDEGYADPTFAMALRNISRRERQASRRVNQPRPSR